MASSIPTSSPPAVETCAPNNLSFIKKNSAILFISVIAYFFLLLTFILTQSFDLAPDEAQYWHWSKYLDISYYSKGPLVAYTINFFSQIFGDNVFGVRFGALIFTFFSGTTLILFLSSEFGLAGIYTALIFLSSLLFFQAGVVMTTDCFAFFFGIIASIAIYKALQSDKIIWWILFGSSIGLGILGKYTLVIYLIGIWGYAIFLNPRIIKKLLVATLIAAFFSAPVMIWNYQHDWVNLAHNFGHVTGNKNSKELKLKFLFELIFGQIGLLGTACYLVFLALKDTFKDFKKGDERIKALACVYIPGLSLIIFVSFFRRIYVNWPLPIYIPLIIVAAAALEKFELNFKFLNKLLLMQLIGLLVAFLIWTDNTFGIAGYFLPTKKLAGWNQLAEEVNKQISPKIKFVYVEDYSLGSELAFYTPKLKGGREIIVGDFQGRRMNQFDVWNDAIKFKDQCGLIIINKERNLGDVQSKFSYKLVYLKNYQTIFNTAVIRDLEFYIGCKFSGSSMQNYSTY